MVIFPEQGIAVAGLFMLFRLVKLFVVPQLFRDIQEAASLLPSVTRLIMFSFWLAASLHVMAMGWILIGGSESARSPGGQYLRSLYWVVTTISTIGFGDYYPDHESASQIIFTIVLQLVGVGMFSYVIANVSNLVSNLDIARSTHQRRLEEVNAYMRTQHIPADLQERFGIIMRICGPAKRESIQQRFSIQFRRIGTGDTSLPQQRPCFKGFAFTNADDLFVRESVRLMKPVVFLPVNL
jgi:voltage-gated potassium channel